MTVIMITILVVLLVTLNVPNVLDPLQAVLSVLETEPELVVTVLMELTITVHQPVNPVYILVKTVLILVPVLLVKLPLTEKAIVVVMMDTMMTALLVKNVTINVELVLDPPLAVLLVLTLLIETKVTHVNVKTDSLITDNPLVKPVCTLVKPVQTLLPVFLVKTLPTEMLIVLVNPGSTMLLQTNV